MKTEVIGGNAIKTINSLVDLSALIIIIMLFAFAGYALWDSNQIYQTAEKSLYAVYKPTVEDEGKSFQELQAVNAEVFSWLNVYGTNIDYPVTQSSDNMKYVNTNAEGEYSLSGAIFLDSGNSKDFSDFNNIVYGHHMEKKVMFGEIGSFSEREMFEERRYGNLYYEGKDYGIEFFAFVHADAYDGSVFSPNVGEERRQAYLDNLLETAVHKRDIGVSIFDRIILLSTCSSGSTNGRDILVGRITGDVYPDTFISAGAGDIRNALGAVLHAGYGNEIWLLMLIPILMSAALIIRCVYVVYNSREHKFREPGTEQG